MQQHNICAEISDRHAEDNKQPGLFLAAEVKQ